MLNLGEKTPYVLHGSYFAMQPPPHTHTHTIGTIVTIVHRENRHVYFQ